MKGMLMPAWTSQYAGNCGVATAWREEALAGVWSHPYGAQMHAGLDLMGGVNSGAEASPETLYGFEAAQPQGGSDLEPWRGQLDWPERHQAAQCTMCAPPRGGLPGQPNSTEAIEDTQFSKPEENCSQGRNNTNEKGDSQGAFQDPIVTVGVH